MSAVLPLHAAPAAELPALREDLRLHPAMPDRDGAPAWTVEDPVTGRFYRIGWMEFELLARWGLGDPAAVLAAVAAQTTLRPQPEELAALAAFLGAHQLTRVADSRALIARATQARRSRLTWLLHHYLFFRIPLVRPQAFLARTLPRVAWLLSPAFGWIALAAAAAGLVLAGRQWDVFLASFRETLSPAGFLGYLAALAAAKLLHELGHAYTATKYRIKVAHMGIAFVVLFPLLYTDTGQAWKLTRRTRFAIAAAGLRAELALAAFATLAWSLTPDGALRGALFFLATTSWLLSLGVNASPFMRFDGYFLLSDALDIPNLHQRTFALARARLRRVFFGWDEPDPEPMKPALRAFLVAFAFATWAYRFAVFLAIALLVYHYFFKALGVALFAVEIGWFIARPVWLEAREWWRRRAETPLRARRRLLILATALLAVGLAPWQSHVRAPAWLHAERQHVVYAPIAARLLDAPPAQRRVAAGATLFRLDSPEIRLRALRARIAAEALARELTGLPGLDAAQERRLRLAEQIAQSLSEWEAQYAELQRLELRAPFAGVLADVDPALGAGVLVAPNQPLAVVVDPTSWTVEAFVPQQDLERIRTGDGARFYRENEALAPLPGKVVAIDAGRIAALPNAMLATEHGGPIATESSPKYAPRDSLYRVRIALDAAPGTLATQRGEAVIDGKGSSPLVRAFEWLAALLVRESGF